jgi:hypothetical protein
MTEYHLGAFVEEGDNVSALLSGPAKCEKDDLRPKVEMM